MIDLDALREMIREVVRDELAKLQRPETGASRLTVAEAAELARVTPGCVRRWIRSGRLASTGAGKLLRVQRVDIDVLLHGGAGEFLSDDEIDRIARRIA